jgi:protocatechuate 3,4-dioxygenase beta subunit
LSQSSNAVQSWAGYTYVAEYSATTAGRTSANLKLCFTPDKAGTYMVRIFGFPQGTTLAIFTDWTVVVTAPTPVATSTTAYATYTDTTTAGAFALASDVTGYLSAPKAAGNLAGVFYVVQSNGSVTNPLTAGGKLTVTMSGSGLAHVVDLAGACSATSAVRAMTGTSTALGQKVCLYSDGTAGTGTVTWSTGSTVLGSGSAAFYGAAAKYTVTTTYSVISTDAAVDPSTTTVSNSNRRSVTVLVTDANGVAVPGADVYMNSSNPLAISGSYQKATSGSTGLARFNLTGVAEGTSDLTFTNKRYATDPLITSSNPEITAGPTTIRVGSTVPDKVTVAFDKTDYAPGEVAVVTVTITDKKGLPVPRGKYQVFNSALSASRAFALGTAPGTANANATCVDAYSVPGAAAATCAAGFTQSVPALEAGSVWISGNTGTATFTMNMPLAPGEVKLSGTTWTYLPNGLGISANAGAAVSATANVTADPGVQAAQDAANEATDAANAATDAANAAAEAADAATAAAQDAADAVSALATSVEAMVSALKKQITALTNLVIKIQKKVKA